MQGVYIPASRQNLESFYQQAKYEKGKSCKRKPEGVSAQCGNDSNAAEQAEQAKNN